MDWAVFGCLMYAYCTRAVAAHAPVHHGHLFDESLPQFYAITRECSVLHLIFLTIVPRQSMWLILP